MKPGTVGEMRRQCAYMNSDERIELKTRDPELRSLILDLEIVGTFPDTVNAAGEWGSTFIIEVRRRQR